MLKSHTRDTDGAVLLQARGADAARRLFQDSAAADQATLAPAEHDQLTRDVEAIERAAASLRPSDPARETQKTPPAAPGAPSRAVWWLIGALWLAMALLTAGALVAIVMLAG